MVDPCNALMIDTAIPAELFNRYAIDTDQLEIGFNIPSFLEFLKGYKKHHDLIVNIIDNELAELNGIPEAQRKKPVCFELKAEISWTYNLGTGERKTDILKTLPLTATIDPSSLRKVPTFGYMKDKFNASFNVNKKQFSEFLAYCRSRGIPELLLEPGWTLSDTMKLSHEIDEHKINEEDRAINLSFKGQLMYNVDISDLKQSNTKDHLSGNYSVSYLSDIDKGIESNEVQPWLFMEMLNGSTGEYDITPGVYPIRITGNIEGIKATYYLAPRMHSE